VRHGTAEPNMAVKPQPAVHRVDHAFSSGRKLPELELSHGAKATRRPLRPDPSPVEPASLFRERTRTYGGRRVGE
jgi:hypothetical protein